MASLEIGGTPTASSGHPRVPQHSGWESLVKIFENIHRWADFHFDAIAKGFVPLYRGKGVVNGTLVYLSLNAQYKRMSMAKEELGVKCLSEWPQRSEKASMFSEIDLVYVFQP